MGMISERDKMAEEYGKRVFANSSGVMQKMVAEIFSAGSDSRQPEIDALRASPIGAKIGELIEERGQARDMLKKVEAERDALKAEVAVARERLGPAGYGILQEVVALRKQFSLARDSEVLALKRRIVALSDCMENGKSCGSCKHDGVLGCGGELSIATDAERQEVIAFLGEPRET